MLVSDSLQVVEGGVIAHHRVVEGRGVVHVLVYDFHSSSEIKVESRVALAALKLT